MCYGYAATNLGDMVVCEGALVFDVVISTLSKRVIRADDYLLCDQRLSLVVDLLDQPLDLSLVALS